MSEKKAITCFKAYDIRGQLGTELDADIAYRIGRAFGEFLKPKTIVVGGDIRLTSEELKVAVSNGLLDSGVDVIDIGSYNITRKSQLFALTSALLMSHGAVVGPNERSLSATVVSFPKVIL